MLAQVLRPVHDLFDAAQHPDLLVGLSAPDDAAVWRLDSQRALIVTTDFFTPVVDDPYDYGQIAAANSFSDVYAMGGQPFLALNVAALPPHLPTEVSSAMLRGSAEKCRQAGVVLAGGHTIQDKEPKFGLVVLGFAHPKKILKKGGARTGDVLVLTKPLGFGVTTTALKQEKALPQDVTEVTEWMKKLNRQAASLAVELGLHGGTDITGFGLLGHALEMADASGVGFRLMLENIPLVSCADRYAALWTFPGGTFDNQLYYGSQVRFMESIPDEKRLLLFDPQTSGGLLLAVPRRKIKLFLEQAEETGQPAWVIGETVVGTGINVL